MVKWSLRDSTGCKQRGEIELAQIPGELLRFEREAARIMKRTGADHVLYGIKIYDQDDRLETVQFYMNPMDDDEFYRLTGRVRNAMIYALHNHKKKRVGAKRNNINFPIDTRGG